LGGRTVEGFLEENLGGGGREDRREREKQELSALHRRIRRACASNSGDSFRQASFGKTLASRPPRVRRDLIRRRVSNK
jgi:hypothetical protein